MESTSAIVFICTDQTLQKVIDKLNLLKGHIEHYHPYILLISNPICPNTVKYLTHGNTQIIYPHQIDLHDGKWKNLAFEYCISEFNLKISSYLSKYFINMKYTTIISIDYRIMPRKIIKNLGEWLNKQVSIHHSQLNCLRPLLPSNAEMTLNDNLLLIHKNTWKDQEYLYDTYSDHTRILKSDRYNYSNMHTSEKARLGDPFCKRHAIREIVKVIGLKETERHFFKNLPFIKSLTHNSTDPSLFKKYKLGIDNLVANMNIYVFIWLSIYVAYKISSKLLVKIFRLCIPTRFNSENKKGF